MLTQKFLESSGNVVAGEVFLSSEVVFLLRREAGGPSQYMMMMPSFSSSFSKIQKNESKSESPKPFFFTSAEFKMKRVVVDA